MALLSSLCAFTHLIGGFTNRSLRALIAEHIPGYSARQMTYDLGGACAARVSSLASPAANATS